MSHRKHAFWTLTAIFAVVMLLGVSGCAGTALSGPVGGDQSSQAGNPAGAAVGTSALRSGTPGAVDLTAIAPIGGNPSGRGTLDGTSQALAAPAPGNLPPGITAVRPLDGSQVCSMPEVAVAIHVSDAMRITGPLDLSMVAFTLDGTSIIPQARLSGTLAFPQSDVTVSYTPTTALAAGLHHAAFTYPSPTGPATLSWSFTVIAGECPVTGGAQAILPPEIASVMPADGSQVCATPQVGLTLHLTDAMLTNGAFDQSKLSFMLDGNNVTQDAQILMSMTSPPSQVSITYAPKSPLQLGTHQASIAYAALRGPYTYSWSFSVVGGSCAAAAPGH